MSADNKFSLYLSRNEFFSPLWNLEGNLCEIWEGNLHRNISTVSKQICFLESITTVKDSVASLPVLSLKVIMSFFLDCFQISFLSLVFRNITDKFLFSLYSLAWGLQYYFSLCLGIFHCFQKILLVSPGISLLPSFFLEFNYMCVRTFHYVSFSFGGYFLCFSSFFSSPCFRQDISTHLSALIDH